jgi:hypothetical protein
MATRPEYEEARYYFTQTAERGAPLLTAVLSMAAKQALFWRRLLVVEAIKGKEASKLAAACDIVDRAATYAVTEGVFAAFISQTTLTPSEVLRFAAPTKK